MVFFCFGSTFYYKFFDKRNVSALNGFVWIVDTIRYIIRILINDRIRYNIFSFSFSLALALALTLLCLAKQHRHRELISFRYILRYTLWSLYAYVWLSKMKINAKAIHIWIQSYTHTYTGRDNRITSSKRRSKKKKRKVTKTEKKRYLCVARNRSVISFFLLYSFFHNLCKEKRSGKFENTIFVVDVVVFFCPMEREIKWKMNETNSCYMLSTYIMYLCVYTARRQ